MTSPLVALLLLAGVTTALAMPAHATPCAPGTTQAPTRFGAISGIVRPVRTATVGACGATTPTGAEAPYASGGEPPLLNHGGPVMSTAAVGGKVVLTPIYWAPIGYSFTTSYKNLINTYLADLAHDSGASTNVFATLPQYTGSNGTIVDAFAVGTPITDTNAYPSAGCPFVSGSVYSDGTGNTTCLTDAQLQAQIDTVAGTSVRDLGHMYLMFTPKGVESCFDAAGTQCSINAGSNSAYCAYHSGFLTGAGETIYAAHPFPVYSSATGYSCTEESLDGPGGGIQHPNGDTDADVEVSPLSHEVAEAITDPEGQTWFDAAGYENGDDCAYIYGPLSGATGVHYNQTINGHHYLTQEEFSNAAFVPLVSGCLQQASPTVTAVAPSAGPTAGGQAVTVTGTGFTGATAVKFGTASAAFTVNSDNSITTTSPAHSAGQVDVTVTSPGGTSAASTGSKFTYTAVLPPAVTGVSPSSGPAAGGQNVTLTGTSLTGATAVRFGTAAATGFTVNSPTSITATAPAHAPGQVDITVTTPGGNSVTGAADHYTFVAAPTVTGVAPTAGPVAGGQSVTITGTALTGTTAVTFGTTPAGTFTVNSDTSITATAPAHSSGQVDVTVTSPGGTSSTGAGDRYAFRPVPTVTKVSPNAGPLAGGQTVTITGTGLLGATKVSFGASIATNVTVTSDTSITVRAPAHAAGTVNVYVTTAGGHNAAVTTDQYTYRPVPTITGVSPASGSHLGGQTVTISGTGFTGTTKVSFGAALATFTFVSSTRLTARTPAHAAGTVNVYVTTAGGHNAAVTADRYRYI